MKVALACTDNGVVLEKLLRIKSRSRDNWEPTVIIGLENNRWLSMISQKWGVPYATLSKETKSMSSMFFDICDSKGVQLVALLHFLKLLEIPQRFMGHVINVHGSLLPSFGGKGRYGLKLQEEIFKSDVVETGCTVHYATNRFDEGEILEQRKIIKAEASDPSELMQLIIDLEAETVFSVLTKCIRRGKQCE